VLFPQPTANVSAIAMDHPDKKTIFSLKAPSFGLAVHRRWNFPTLRRDEGGAVAILTALALVMLIGLVALALDVGMWYRTNRALQNAADAAVIAAATNGTGTYQAEAKAVAATYGFVDGAGGITVTALNNQTCPSGSTDCYKVTVAQSSAPTFFSPVVGSFSPALAGTATASGSPHSYCLLTLAGLPGHSTTDPGLDGRGLSKGDMQGCSVMSNNGANCTGHDLNATYGDAHGTNSGCGTTQHSNVPQVADPYASLASNIPSNTCGTTASSFPQEPSSSITKWSGSKSLPASTIICGDLQLTGNTTLTTASPGSVLVIENGQLDTNGYTLATDSASALTIIFSGPTVSGKTYTHYPTGGGTLDFMAPTSGTWKGISLYQDPAVTTGVDFTYAGNSPTWNITGVVYFPHASITFKGIVNKSAFGASCLLFIADNMTMKGTAKIEQTTTSSCASAGVTLPSNNVGGIALVM
jgi:Flp pilus assembly protein TadG